MIEQQPTFMPSLTNLADFEYKFELSLEALPRKSLFIPSGITSVGAESHARGVDLVCADTMYALNSFDLEKKMTDMLRDVSLECERNPHCNPEMTSTWQVECDRFWQDFQPGKNEGRYVAIENLLQLPWQNSMFELACCPSLMIEDQTAVLNLINELLRVSHEVRIFPWQVEGESIKQTLGAVLLVLQQEDFGVELRANTMLRIWSKTCVVM